MVREMEDLRAPSEWALPVPTSSATLSPKPLGQDLELRSHHNAEERPARPMATQTDVTTASNIHPAA